MFLVSVSGWFLVFLEITRALIPLLALWLNRAYPVSSVLFRLVTFRTASWAHLFTLHFPLSPLPFRCILRAKFNLPFFALKSLGCVWPKRDGERLGQKVHLASTFCLFLIYFSFYALLRIQLPPANFDLLLLQFPMANGGYFCFFLASFWVVAEWQCHLKLSAAVSQ